MDDWVSYAIAGGILGAFPVTWTMSAPLAVLSIPAGLFRPKVAGFAVGWVAGVAAIAVSAPVLLGSVYASRRKRGP